MLHNGNPSVNVYDVNKKQRHNSGKPENDNIKIKSNGDSKTEVMVVGDSLLKHLPREDLSSKKNNVKVITHPRSTTEDMFDYFKPIAQRKPDALIIHTGRNDLTNGVNTIKKVRKLVKVVREIDESEKIKIGYSSVIYRKGKDLEDERNEVNMKLKKYCEGKGFVFIENANLNESVLNNSKLHLNKKGTNILTQNIKRSFNQFGSSVRHTHEVDITNSNLFENNETDQVLKVLRNDNPSNLNFCYLNINSVRNKFTDLQTIINGNVDIVSIAETKLDASFPSAQFTLEGYHTPYRLDINNKSGGILVYVKSSIPSRRLFFEE